MTKKELEAENSLLRMRIADLERRVNNIEPSVDKYPEQGKGYRSSPDSPPSSKVFSLTPTLVAPFTSSMVQD